MSLPSAVRALSIWAVPVITVVVLALTSAVWGRMVAGIVLGAVVAVTLGWVLGAGVVPGNALSQLAISETKAEDTRNAGKRAGRNAVLTGADLTGADLTGADLEGMDLRDVDLTRALLRRANLRGARLSSTKDDDGTTGRRS